MILRSGRKLSQKSHNINFIVCEKDPQKRKRIPRFGSYFKKLVKNKNQKILATAASAAFFA
jgi:hypothetical protein|tara:strand:+ start:401 stop:583 length:183 start_codon:yes stop_codon:yes gene_type:complete